MNETLYILMRSDMASLNPGKAMAQAAHAANAFQGTAPNSDENFQNWMTATTQSFGTTIVLDVGNEYNLNLYVQMAKNFGLLADIVLDPTYPVRDGQVTHLLPVNTCGYVFAPDRTDPMIKVLLGNFPLYR